jgi:hypothetical protein
MTIHVPKVLVFLGGGAAALVIGYALYKEIPPLYRYLVKFEAM